MSQVNSKNHYPQSAEALFPLQPGHLLARPKLPPNVELDLDETIVAGEAGFGAPFSSRFSMGDHFLELTDTGDLPYDPTISL